MNPLVRVMAIAFILIVLFAVLSLLLLISPFMVKASGVVMVLFGFILVFALGDLLGELSGGAMEIGGAFLVAGVVMILFM